MVKCSFCGKQITKGTGEMYIKADGKIFYFCSNKCEKNQISLKRKGRNLKWTETFAAEKKKKQSSVKKK